MLGFLAQSAGFLARSKTWSSSSWLFQPPHHHLPAPSWPLPVLPSWSLWGDL